MGTMIHRIISLQPELIPLVAKIRFIKFKFEVSNELL